MDTVTEAVSGAGAAAHDVGDGVRVAAQDSLSVAGL